MTVDFEAMRAADRPPLQCVALAESRGMTRLVAFKAIFTHWGAEPFAVENIERYGSGYPSRAAQAAATIGLAAVVLAYPRASCEDFVAFDRTTGISRKVDALARADRADDALRFYERLDPHLLRLASITEADARDLVRLLRRHWSPQLSVAVDPVESYQWGWVFTPHPEPAGGRPPRPPADARPVIVDRFTGVAIEIGTDAPIEDQVRCYEETGWCSVP